MLSIIIATQQGKAQIITTVAGNGSCDYGHSGDTATTIGLCSPLGIAVDKTGNLFVSQWGGGYSYIYKVDTSGIITIIGGTSISGYNGDGNQATITEFNYPAYLAVDHFGNLFIPDEYNYRVRKIDTSGIVTTIAGTGIGGYNGDSSHADSSEVVPSGISIGADGDFFVADNTNNRVRKIDYLGYISTVAGNGSPGYSGDGFDATGCELEGVANVVVDTWGDIFIADLFNDRIRKVNSAGVITTMAGNGTAGYSGDSFPATGATIYGPEGLALDGAGNLYFSDEGNNVIRKIDTSGIITTVVGTGVFGFWGDGGPATAAELKLPAGIAFDTAGNLFIADWHNNRIRKVSHLGVPLGVNRNRAEKQEVNIYPNPATNWIAVEGVNGCEVSVINLFGQIVRSFFATNELEMVNIEGLPNGTYIIQITGSNGTRNNLRIVKQ